MSTTNSPSPDVMAVSCKLCGTVFHLMGVPYCYSDKGMQKELRDYAKQDWIECKVVPLDSVEFESCKPCCIDGIGRPKDKV